MKERDMQGQGVKNRSMKGQSMKDLEMKRRFAASNVYGKEECRNCWAKFYCSGGCNANNWQYMGNVLDSFDLACEMEKKRLECAIMIQAALAE